MDGPAHASIRADAACQAVSQESQDVLCARFGIVGLPTLRELVLGWQSVIGALLGRSTMDTSGTPSVGAGRADGASGESDGRMTRVRSETQDPWV